jgi:hypothetical protein
MEKTEQKAVELATYLVLGINAGEGGIDLERLPPGGREHLVNTDITYDEIKERCEEGGFTFREVRTYVRDDGTEWKIAEIKVRLELIIKTRSGEIDFKKVPEEVLRHFADVTTYEELKTWSRENEFNIKEAAAL